MKRLFSDITEKAIIYTRISSKNQMKGHSLSFQYSECYKYCKKYNFDIVKSYKEIYSARIINKQSILIDIINNYDNINLIIYEPTRLSRNLKDFINILDEIKKKNIIIHFVDNELVSTNSLDMKEILNKVYDGEMESNLISKRVKNILSYKNRIDKKIISLVKKLYYGDTIKNIEKNIYRIIKKKIYLYDKNNNINIDRVEYGNLCKMDIVKLLNTIPILQNNKKFSVRTINNIINQ